MVGGTNPAHLLMFLMVGGTNPAHLLMFLMVGGTKTPRSRDAK
jgi:hypothetical protein